MANPNNALLFLMKKKHKDLGDYILIGLGITSAAVGSAIIVAELPAVLLTGAGVLVFCNAFGRLQSREDCCDDPTCECNDN